MAAASALLLAGGGLLALLVVPAPVRAEGPQAVPDVPNMPAVTALYIGKVDVEWNDVPGADSYDLQIFAGNRWYDLPSEDIDPAYSAGVVDISYYGPGAIVSGLHHESLYEFRVRANNSVGSSDWSEPAFMHSTASISWTWDHVPEPVNSEATGAPTVTGMASVGETLTASIADIEDGNGLDRVKFRYQWIRSEGATEIVIRDAASSTYTLSNEDLGKAVRVRVSFTDRGGYQESLTSAPTGTVGATTAGTVNSNNPAEGQPTIIGSAQVGETLSVNTSDISDLDGISNASFSYQWVSSDGRAFTDNQDATDETYTLSDDDLGKTIKVRVTFTDDAGNEEGLTSAATAAVVNQGVCPDGGYDPALVELEVTEVPIVVESTTEEYFVLYVRHDVDGSEVEIPVSVTLGESGTTTLTENVAALPAERYRVDKYLIANPGDVDDDCITDIAELVNIGRMNPVNPGAALDPIDGALAIPDQEMLQTLASVYPRSPFKSRPFLKFVITGVDTARPRVYFQNTNTRKPHFVFSRGSPADDLPRSVWTDGTLIVGNMGYDPEYVGPDGDIGLYYYWIKRYHHSFSRMSRVHTVLAASMPVVNDNLSYYISSEVLPQHQSDLPLYRGSRVHVVVGEDILPSTDFLAVNPGESYGFLRVMELDERPHPNDVVIYETLPNELSHVSGIITTVPQTPLSHVNLRAVQDGVPNAFIRDALDDGDIDDLIGSYVHYAVTEEGHTIRAATPEEVDSHDAASRPSAEQTPERDLSVTQITALGDIGFHDWTAFGVKAANVAVLGTLGFPEGTVPEGFAVPFYFYDEFMKHNDLYDDVEEMLANEDFQTDYEVQEDELKKLRKKIKRATTPDWIITALEEMHATYPEGQSLRYRSSTNNEDLPGFSGAGLYDSKTQDPDETEEDGIDKSIKGVWASLWNFRAFAEREFHRVDHLSTAMGVLVHPNYTGELANGVAVSFDPIYGTDDGYYVNTQIGEDLVTNPDAHSVPEEVVLHRFGSYEVIATSNQVPSGQLLMSYAQNRQLRRHLVVIHDKFAELYDVEADERFAMEIEFKITSENILAIKQARPWVFSGNLAADTSTSQPTISGTAQVGETLTVDTTDIADEDGLTNVSYSYQWVRNDGSTDSDIHDATSSTYTLVEEDEGKTIKVRVSFTDDAGNDETLISAATAAVAAAGTTPGQPEHLRVVPRSAQRLKVAWEAPSDSGGSAVTSYKVQWKQSAGSWDAPADVSEETVSGTTHTIRGLSEGVEYAVRVIATNEAGDSPPSAEQTGTPRDTTPPQRVRARVDGATLRVWYDEALDEDSVPAADAFDVGVALKGGSVTWKDKSARRQVDQVSVKQNTVELTLASPATSEDYVVITYTPPADEEVGRVRDTAGNAAAGFVIEVGNDTEEAPGDDGTTDEDAGPHQPLTASAHGVPQSHDGENVFTFELRFSEEFGLSYRTLRDHAFTVTNGTVTRAPRLDKTSNMTWEIHVRPDSNEVVTILLPIPMDCDTEGAICTEDGRKLSNKVGFTVAGPGED